DVTCPFAGKARGGITGAAKYIAGRQEQRFAMLCFGAALLAGAYRQGVETSVLQIAIQPPGLPIGCHFGLRHDQLLCRPICAFSTSVIALAASLRDRSIRPR